MRYRNTVCIRTIVGIAFLWERWQFHGLKRRREHAAPTVERGGIRGKVAFRGNSSRGLNFYLRSGAISVFVILATTWMTARIYLEEQALRNAPRLHTCLVLKEIERFKPFTTFMFSDQPIFSFHADIPMPPHLAVLSLKRFWTGEMTNSGLVHELETLKPGLVLLGKASQQVPYEHLLNRQYKLVYQDGENRLYAHQSISKRPPL